MSHLKVLRNFFEVILKKKNAELNGEREKEFITYICEMVE